MLSTAGSWISARSNPGKSPHATLNGRFHNCATSSGTGSVIPSALCIAAKVSYAARNAFSRSGQVWARTTVHRVADSSGPHSNRENAVPNHFEYGAYCRSMASNYNHVLRPPVVAVADGEARVIVRRETEEETGIEVKGPLVALGDMIYKKSRKQVHCFAGPAPEGAAPRVASWEVDQARFVPLDEARRLIHPDQAVFLDRLLEHLGSA